MVGSISKGAGTGSLNFNGGTLKSCRSIDTFVTGLTAATVQSGGAVIDSNTYNVGIAQALVHDPALGDTVDGGLTKSGDGTLTISSSLNDYTGGTTIDTGTLATENYASLGSGMIDIKAAGTYAFTTNGGNQPAFSNALSGAGTFTVTGSGGNQSFWSGDFSGYSGTLTINADSGLWVRSSTNTGSTSMKVNLTGALGLYDNESNITRTYHIGELTGSSGSFIWGNPNTNNAVTLSIGALDTSTTFAGIIKNNWQGDTSSTLGLTKVGSGTLTLSGPNTYTGDTTVNGGILAVNENSIANAGKLIIDGGKVAPTGTETVETLFFGTTQQAVGTWGATDSGADHVDDSRFSGRDGVVNVTTGPSNTYALWIDKFPGAAGAPGFTQDADNDGITNGIEQILGTDPSVSSSGLTQISASTNSFTFRHTQTNAPVSDVTKSYEWSTDLVEWQPSGAANTGGTIGTITATTVTDNTAPDNDIIEVVVTASGASTTKLFARLVANQ